MAYMDLQIGMSVKTYSVQGEYIEGEVMRIYCRTFVLVSKRNAKRYLVKLETLGTGFLLQEEAV